MRLNGKNWGEVGELIRGNGLQRKELTDKGIPAIHYGEIYTYYGLSTDKTKSFVSKETAKKLKKAQTNDLLITMTSEDNDGLLKPIAWFGDEVVISGDMAIFKHQQNAKYLAYYFQTSQFQNSKYKYITGVKVKRISKSDLAKIPIPLPPIEKQKKIVEILDKFYTLTHSISEGLPKEIELREKQYQYYLNLLLDFPKPDKEKKDDHQNN